MEPEGSLPHSQVPTTCPYPEPARSCPCPTSHFLKIHLLANYVAAAVNQPAIYRLPTFHLPNLMSHFRCFGCTTVSVQVRGRCSCFYGEELLALRPIPKLEDHPLSAVRDCLFNIFAATLHIGGRSSIRNRRTRHAVVTGTHLSRRYSLLIGVNAMALCRSERTFHELHFDHPWSIRLMVIDFDRICIVRLRVGQTIKNVCLQLITLSLRERGIQYGMNITVIPRQTSDPANEFFD